MLFTETLPSVRYQANRDSRTQPSRISEPPGYPTPSERSAKSASVVPAVVEATIVAQYNQGLKRRARICAQARTARRMPKIAVPMR